MPAVSRNWTTRSFCQPERHWVRWWWSTESDHVCSVNLPGCLKAHWHLWHLHRSQTNLLIWNMVLINRVAIDRAGRLRSPTSCFHCRASPQLAFPPGSSPFSPFLLDSDINVSWKHRMNSPVCELLIKWQSWVRCSGWTIQCFAAAYSSCLWSMAGLHAELVAI